MQTFELIYKPTQDSPEAKVTVYDISQVFNADGDMTQTLVTAWAIKQKQWIVAPLWCFEPITTKKLEENI